MRTPVVPCFLRGQSAPRLRCRKAKKKKTVRLDFWGVDTKAYVSPQSGAATGLKHAYGSTVLSSVNLQEKNTTGVATARAKHEKENVSFS